MAMIYQPPKYITDTKTGKRVPMRDANGKKILAPVWYMRIFLHDGKRKTIKLPATTKAEAQKQAQIFEARELEITTGLRAAPTQSEKAGKRSIEEFKEEYLAWGEVQGGRGGRPWSLQHRKDKRRYLDWWIKTLNFYTMDDTRECLPAVEHALREVAQTGRPDKRNIKKNL